MTKSAIERLREPMSDGPMHGLSSTTAPMAERLTRGLVAEGGREIVARLLFPKLSPWVTWDDFDTRLEARGGRRHPVQETALEYADAILEHFAAMALGEGG